MRVDLCGKRTGGVALVTALSLCVGGCSLINDLAPRGSSTVATSASASTGAVDLRPAVLVQNGQQPGVTSAPPTRAASLQDLPPLPKDGTAAAPPAKLLSPEEKARVIAELEALASNPAGGTPTATNANCATTVPAGSAAKTSPAVGTSCAAPPKVAARQ